MTVIATESPMPGTYPEGVRITTADSRGWYEVLIDGRPLGFVCRNHRHPRLWKAWLYGAGMNGQNLDLGDYPTRREAVVEVWINRHDAR